MLLISSHFVLFRCVPLRSVAFLPFCPVLFFDFRHLSADLSGRLFVSSLFVLGHTDNFLRELLSCEDLLVDRWALITNPLFTAGAGNVKRSSTSIALSALLLRCPEF